MEDVEVVEEVLQQTSNKKRGIVVELDDAKAKVDDKVTLYLISRFVFFTTFIASFVSWFQF